jgi:hypothetical protein
VRNTIKQQLLLQFSLFKIKIPSRILIECFFINLQDTSDETIVLIPEHAVCPSPSEYQCQVDARSIFQKFIIDSHLFRLNFFRMSANLPLIMQIVTSSSIVCEKN